MNYGGKDWPISEADFMFGQASPTVCVGAIFEIPISGNVIQWIVGDTFLKNVYSVYRFSPPSIGFAQLAPSIAGGSPPPSGGATNPSTTARGVPTVSNDLPPGVTGSPDLPIPTPNAAAGTFSSLSWTTIVGSLMGVVVSLMV
jgi:cathepsin D